MHVHVLLEWDQGGLGLGSIQWLRGRICYGTQWVTRVEGSYDSKALQSRRKGSVKGKAELKEEQSQFLYDSCIALSRSIFSKLSYREADNGAYKYDSQLSIGTHHLNLASCGLMQTLWSIITIFIEMMLQTYLQFRETKLEMFLQYNVKGLVEIQKQPYSLFSYVFVLQA